MWQRVLLVPFLWGALAVVAPAYAEKHYDTGITDTEILLGHSIPLSGPASATGVLGLAEADYFRMINDQGGVNGRKIKLLQLDDGYNPARTLEAVRRLVEQDHVFVIYAIQGTPPNIAIQKYLTINKVPQLFIGSGAGRWNDPAHFPWTIPVIPSYSAEAKIFAKYLLAHKPGAKIAMLYQNDDFGRDYFSGLKAELGAKLNQLVAVQTYEPTDPTVSSQMISLQSSGADALMIAAIPNQAAQAIRKSAELGWHPMIFLNYIANSPATTLKAAGRDASKGVISTFFVRDAGDPQWQGTQDLVDFLAWQKKYATDLTPNDPQNATGYVLAQLMVEVLRRCGDNLTRANVIEQATHVSGFAAKMLLPGVTISYSPTDYSPFHKLQLEQFDGASYRPLGKPVGLD